MHDVPFHGPAVGLPRRTCCLTALNAAHAPDCRWCEAYPDYRWPPKGGVLQELPPDPAPDPDVVFAEVRRARRWAINALLVSLLALAVNVISLVVRL